MLSIFLLILILFIIYRFIIRIVMLKSTDYYLEKFKTKFYSKNPQIKQKEMKEESDTQFHVFHFTKKGNQRKKGTHHG
jgi:hypothetical protein